MRNFLNWLISLFFEEVWEEEEVPFSEEEWDEVLEEPIF